MAVRLRTVTLGEISPAVQKFFKELGDEPFAIECEGEILCLVYPAQVVTAQLAGEAFQSVRGAWGVPDEICDQIAEGNR
jgi:hypothetical protein